MAAQDKRLELLWAPWRLSYVTAASAKPPAGDDPCFICKGLADADDRGNLIAWRRSHSVVYLNRYPYNGGHLMVVPYRHVAQLALLEKEELTEMAVLTQLSERVLTEAYSPQGINVGMNLGRPAGAGIVDHLHIHLVPRWNGDTNFMTVVGEVRVLPEELPRTAERLRPLFQKLA